VLQRLQQLQEELDLINRHLDDQQTRQKTIDADYEETKSRISLTEGTLSSVHAEKEKLLVLIEGLSTY
jgi:septal ring factor EnvC (AmiA/AmiB activator)